MSKQTRVSHPIYSLLPTEIEGFGPLACVSYFSMEFMLSVEELQTQGKTVVFVLVDRNLKGAIALAAGVLFAWGAVLMSASTVIVAINAQLLRLKTEAKPEAKAAANPEAKPEGSA